MRSPTSKLSGMSDGARKRAPRLGRACAIAGRGLDKVRPRQKWQAKPPCWASEARCTQYDVHLLCGSNCRRTAPAIWPSPISAIAFWFRSIVRPARRRPQGPDFQKLGARLAQNPWRCVSDATAWPSTRNVRPGLSWPNSLGPTRHKRAKLARLAKAGINGGPQRTSVSSLVPHLTMAIIGCDG